MRYLLIAVCLLLVACDNPDASYTVNSPPQVAPCVANPKVCGPEITQGGTR